jgi:hypothetical protein
MKVGSGIIKKIKASNGGMNLFKKKPENVFVSRP